MQQEFLPTAGGRVAQELDVAERAMPFVDFTSEVSLELWQPQRTPAMDLKSVGWALTEIQMCAIVWLTGFAESRNKGGREDEETMAKRHLSGYESGIALGRRGCPGGGRRDD
jgi:hypothetical protein